MRSQRRACMRGSTKRIVWNAADKFTAISASQRSGGNSSRGLTYWIPALFTRMSKPPISVSA